MQRGLIQFEIRGFILSRVPPLAMTMRPRLIIIAFGLYLLATLVFLYPLSIHPGSRVFETGDSYLNAWIWSWETHALTTPGAHFFDGNIFYPEANTLALSELILPDQVLFAPLLRLTHNPLVAYNLTLLATFPLSALSMLALVFYLTRRFSAAFIAGFIFGFTPIRLSHLHHAQLLTLVWLPLLLLFLDRWLNERRWHDVLATALLYVLQYLTTVYLALYMVPILLLYGMLHLLLVQERWRNFPRLLLQGGVSALVVAALLSPILKHYRALEKIWDFSPQESLKVFFSSDLWTNLLAIFPTNILYGKILQAFSKPPYERFYFTGIVVVALIFLAWKARGERIVKIYLALSAAGYLIALGPYLQISGHVTKIPLPYHWTFDLLPGFSRLRVPARAGLILLATLTVLAAYGWIHFCNWLQSRRPAFSEKKIVTGTMLVLALEFLSIPLPLYPEVSGTHIPPVYSFLKSDQAPGGVLELPAVFSKYGAEPTVRIYTYFSAYHFKPIVIGYSDNFPPPFLELVAAARRLPADDAMDLFEAIGVRTIVLHIHQMPPGEIHSWRSALSAGTRLKQVQVFPDGDEVARILPRLRTTQDLNDGNWQLSMGSKTPSGKGVQAILQCKGLRTSAADVLVHPQLPHLPDRPESRVAGTPLDVLWTDHEDRFIAHEGIMIRLPYVLNQASIPISLEKPRKPGNYRLRMEVLEKPSLVLLMDVTVP